MSLDVYLTTPGTKHQRKSSGIFIREAGQTREISREEWDRLQPGREPIIADMADDSSDAYSANITHNLGEMAEAAGIYKHLWRPEELGITKARELIKPLHDGLVALRTAPEEFRKHNPKNGWGDYAALVAFVDDYLSACMRWPDAEVRVWR